MLMHYHVYPAISVEGCHMYSQGRQQMDHQRQYSIWNQMKLQQIGNQQNIIVPDGSRSLLGKTTEQLQQLQEEDPDVGPVLKAKRADQKPPADEARSHSIEERYLLKQWDQLQVENRLLYWRHRGGDGVDSLQLVVPRNDILSVVHRGS